MARDWAEAKTDAEGKSGMRMVAVLTVAAVAMMMMAAIVLWLAHGDAVVLALMLGDAVLNCF